jgi:hypothetical protein
MARRAAERLEKQLPALERVRWGEFAGNECFYSRVRTRLA